jgi:hypothetical protein
MEQQSVRNTYKYRLHPTPEQTQAVETVLSRCQALYNVALEQRKTWRERSQGKSTTSLDHCIPDDGVQWRCPIARCWLFTARDRPGRDGWSDLAEARRAGARCTYTHASREPWAS